MTCICGTTFAPRGAKKYCSVQCRRNAYRAAHMELWRSRAAAFRAAHPEKIRAYNAAYRAAHSAIDPAWHKRYDDARYAADPEGERARSARWKAAHPVEDAERKRAWYRANAVNQRARVKAWRAANPEKMRHQLAVRRGRKLGNGGSHTLKEWQEKLELFAHLCAYCGEARPLSIDHKIPLTRGGTDDISNIVPSCRPCNSRKGTRTASEFLSLKVA